MPSLRLVRPDAVARTDAAEEAVNEPSGRRQWDPKKAARYIVDAAWEYSDEEEEACGFMVTLIDGRRAYVERQTANPASRSLLTVRQLPPGATWREAPARSASGAVGWVEEPEEVNALLAAMAHPVEG